MPEPDHSPSSMTPLERERRELVPILPLGKFTPSAIAYFMELAGKQAWREEIDVDSPLRDDASEVYFAVDDGMRELIDHDTDRARSAIELMAHGTDWQKELAVYPLELLLRRDHAVNDNDHILRTAALLTRVLHAEKSTEFSHEVGSAFEGGRAANIMGNIMREDWARPDIQSWFKNELLKYYSADDLYSVFEP